MERKKFPFSYIPLFSGGGIMKAEKSREEKRTVYDVLNAYLENGLKVILHKIPGVKTMACGLWIRQGSAYETDKNNGLSHLSEHLLLNPKDVNNSEYKQWMNQVSSEGVIYNAATTKEYTCYYFSRKFNPCSIFNFSYCKSTHYNTRCWCY